MSIENGIYPTSEEMMQDVYDKLMDNKQYDLESLNGVNDQEIGGNSITLWIDDHKYTLTIETSID